MYCSYPVFLIFKPGSNPGVLQQVYGKINWYAHYTEYYSAIKRSKVLIDKIS